MNTLTADLRQSAQACLPSLKGEHHHLWVFDGDLAEFEEAHRLTQAGQQAWENTAFAELDHPCAAPVGPHQDSATRTARCWGLAVTEREDGFELKGAAVAQGSFRAGWHESLDGLFLVIGVELPQCLALEGQVDALMQEQLKVRCLRQFEQQLPLLMAQIDGVEEAQSIEMEFFGAWDESMELLKRRLGQKAVLAWLERRTATCELALAA